MARLDAQDSFQVKGARPFLSKQTALRIAEYFDLRASGLCRWLLVILSEWKRRLMCHAQDA